MINTGYFYKLPYKMGEVVVLKYKTIGKKLPDFKHFNETGEVIMRKMDFGDGFVPKPQWLKVNTRGYALNTVRAQPTRYLHRSLNKAAKNQEILAKYLVPEMKKIKRKVFKMK